MKIRFINFQDVLTDLADAVYQSYVAMDDGQLEGKVSRTY